MNIKKRVVEFGTVFAATLITAALMTFLWNLIGHGQSVWTEKAVSVSST
jgi:hypothetical protein